MAEWSVLFSTPGSLNGSYSTADLIPIQIMVYNSKNIKTECNGQFYFQLIHKAKGRSMKKLQFFCLGAALISLVTMMTSDTCSANRLYMPEGYLGESTDEFVAVLNSGDTTAEGTCTIYYEDGTQLIFDVSFPAERRSGITLKDKGVQWDRGFSIVLDTNADLTATLVHYDNGMALGANFSEVTSRIWSISEGYASEHTRDYLSIFNPNDNNVDIELTLYTDYASQQKYTLHVPAASRYSLYLHDYLPSSWWALPYGMTLDSSGEIVASLSHYDDNLGDGSLMMGDPSVGSPRGYSAEGWTSESGFEYINILNPTSDYLSVDINVNYNNGISQTFQRYIYPGERDAFELSSVANANEGYTIDYQSVGTGFDSYLYLLSGSGKFGEVIAYDDYSGPGYTSKIVADLEAGDYTIEATSYWYYNVGDFTLALNGKELPVETTDDCVGTIALGQVLNGTLEDNCSSVNRSDRYAKYYTFTLTEPTRVKIELAGRSNPIVNFVHYDMSGLNGTSFVSEPARRWEFGEGFRSMDVEQVQEYLLIYNPNDEDVEVVVTLYYSDGGTPTDITVTIPSYKKEGLALHTDARLRPRSETGDIWYGIVVQSQHESLGVIPYFTHYDLSFGGSFALNGTPRD